MERNALVDRLKGYACFLVLFGHVIMGIRLSGVYIPGFFEGLEKFIWSFHVALFLFLSGVVYKMTDEWRGKKSKSAFVMHKLLSLGVPYVVFSVVYILINSIVDQTNTHSSVYDILNIWKTPVAQYWFLYALFFVFCIWTLFSGMLKNYQITIIAVLIGYLVPLTGASFFGFDVVFYAALPFGIGTCVNINFFSNLSAVKKIIFIAVHVFLGIIFVTTNMIETLFIKEIMLIVGIFSSIMFISLLQDLKPIKRFLEFINKYSFQTYLLHTIFTAGIRIVLIRLNVTWWWVHVPVGCIVGIMFSVIAAIVAKKVKFLDFCFFPTKVIKVNKK